MKQRNQKTLKLASKFSLPATEYASQANADLGIRDSGKTYTAMKAAEQLLLAGIPIIVYDPVGVWKNIRVGINGKKGFPVIVAGGDSSADIILTPENAVQIVRAAMKAGISLIIDLYSPSLANKSKWIKIVQETIDVLMYENRDHGLRHIFIEEASEFIPQRVQPQQGKVYSSIERVSRMGRNASLGLTIINQRAEEINKAILELCALSFLHKQVGKNSLTSIKKWFALLGVENTAQGEAVIKQLPQLKQGECVIINSNAIDTTAYDWYFKVKILPKQTFHPSPEKGVPAKAARSNVNISSFIKKLNEQLNKKEKKKEEVKFTIKTHNVPVPKNPVAVDTAIAKNIFLLEAKNKEYESQLEIAKKEIKILIEDNTRHLTLYNTIMGQLKPLPKRMLFVSKVKDVTPLKKQLPANGKSGKFAGSEVVQKKIPVLPARITPDGKNDSAKNRMIKGVTMFPHGINKAQLAILCGISPTSGTYGVYYRELKRDFIITETSGLFYPNDEAYERSKDIRELKTSVEDLLDMWYGILGDNSGLTRILKVVADHRWNKADIETVAGEAGMVASSGTFGVYYRKLRRYGLIEFANKHFKLSDNFQMPSE